MAFGELTIKDFTADNVANNNFQPNTVLVLDTANSVNGVVAATVPSASGVRPLGVCIDKAHLDPSGSPSKGEGIALRQYGFAFCKATSSITVGDMVMIGDTAGGVATASHTGGGSVPVPLVGMALSGTTTAGNTVLVQLMIGSTY